MAVRHQGGLSDRLPEFPKAGHRRGVPDRRDADEQEEQGDLLRQAPISVSAVAPL